ncbi:hypothetical protein [Streptomyces lavendofoliae]|uniref:hypothetical protein n=1 Tax=Streptomyces lavendofoliae TaxID=67314 RepID=UPI001E342B53|nr:hypothetical protein [Streptomyces lavendofoliae]
MPFFSAATPAPAVFFAGALPLVAFLTAAFPPPGAAGASSAVLRPPAGAVVPAARRPPGFPAAGPARSAAPRPEDAADPRGADAAASAVSARFADRSAFFAAAAAPRSGAAAPPDLSATVLRARAAGFDAVLAVLFFPVVSLAAAPFAVAVDLPDAAFFAAVFFAAVFFATISRPLHIL